MILVPFILLFVFIIPLFTLFMLTTGFYSRIPVRVKECTGCKEMRILEEHIAKIDRQDMVQLGDDDGWETSTRYTGSA